MSTFCSFAFAVYSSPLGWGLGPFSVGSWLLASFFFFCSSIYLLYCIALLFNSHFKKNKKKDWNDVPFVAG